MVTTNPLQPRGGLLDMMGQGDSGFAGWLNPRRNAIINFGTGLIGGDSARDAMRGAAQGLSEGRKADTAYALLQQEQAEKQRQLQEQSQQRNATLEFLQQSHPDLAQAVQGGLSIGEAWGEAIRRSRPGGGSDASFSQTPVFLSDPDGNQHIAQMSSGGGILVNGEVVNSLPDGWKITARPENFSSVNLGSGFGTFDRNTGTFSGPQVPIAGAPSANMDVSLGADGGRVMTPAAGSPQAIEQQQAEQAKMLAGRQADERAAYILNAINSAVDISGFWNTGPAGRLSRAAGEPGAVTLEDTVGTVKANLGFAELQAMRDASPTGGALGQVTERELAFLQSTIASLNPDQGEETLDRNLRLIANLIQRNAVYRRIDQMGIDVNSPQAQEMLSQFPLPAALPGAPTSPATGMGKPSGATSNGVPWSIE